MSLGISHIMASDVLPCLPQTHVYIIHTQADIRTVYEHTQADTVHVPGKNLMGF